MLLLKGDKSLALQMAVIVINKAATSLFGMCGPMQVTGPRMCHCHIDVAWGKRAVDRGLQLAGRILRDSEEDLGGHERALPVLGRRQPCRSSSAALH